MQVDHVRHHRRAENADREQHRLAPLNCGTTALLGDDAERGWRGRARRGNRRRSRRRGRRLPPPGPEAEARRPRIAKAAIPVRIAAGRAASRTGGGSRALRRGTRPDRSPSRSASACTTWRRPPAGRTARGRPRAVAAGGDPELRRERLDSIAIRFERRSPQTSV